MAFSLSLKTEPPSTSTRRAFFSRTASTVSSAALLTAGTVASLSRPSLALAAPEIFTTPNGVKYAVLQKAKQKGTPQKGDIVAIEYTGYLSDGTIFDGTHSEGKKNVLMFELGGNAVIPGVNEMVMNMDGVGEKVQAIIPPELAFGDKGLCLENGECLIKPKSTLVYDVYLKQSAIPPP